MGPARLDQEKISPGCLRNPVGPDAINARLRKRAVTYANVLASSATLGKSP
jgi:hypothetical protein